MGDWEPNEDDGQSRASLDGLVLIATWTPDDDLVLERDDNGVLVAGGGGQLYLGLSD